MGSAGARAALGIAYSHDEIASVPWSLHVVKLERTNTDYEVHTMLGKGRVIGLTTIFEQLNYFPASLGQPVAAINGDFFDKNEPYVGDPRGIQIMRGELVSSSRRLDLLPYRRARGTAHWPGNASLQSNLANG